MAGQSIPDMHVAVLNNQGLIDSTDNSTLLTSAADANASITGAHAMAFLGRALSRPGDVNDDGVPDLFIGVSGRNNDVAVSTGVARVFFGGGFARAIDAGQSDVRLVGEAAGDDFGRAVSTDR